VILVLKLQVLSIAQRSRLQGDGDQSCQGKAGNLYGPHWFVSRVDHRLYMFADGVGDEAECQRPIVAPQKATR
jgi:hypothetical protein